MKKRKGKGTHGAYARNHPLSVRWAVDYDYLNQLTPEQKHWLAQFSDEYYSASFTADDAIHRGVLARRERYRQKNSANADAFGIAQGTHTLSYSLERLTPNATRRDYSVSPDYTTRREYKEALAAYRALLPRNPRQRLRTTSELRAAKQRLDSIKRRITNNA